MRVLVTAFLGYWVIFSVAHASSQDRLTSEDQQAINKAIASIKWLESYQCPALGFPPVVKGLQSSEDVAASLQANWSFATERLQAIRTLLVKRDEIQAYLARRKSSPGDRLVQQLDDIESDVRVTSARVSTALVYWTLANWVELAGINAEFAYPVSGVHPLNEFLGRESQLRNFIGNFTGLPGGSEYLSPVEAKFHKCLISVQNQVLERNANSIYEALNKAVTSTEAASVTRPYGVVDMSFTANGIPLPEVIGVQQERIAVLQAEERRKEEERRLAEEKARLERQMIADQQNAELRKRLEEERRKARLQAERNLPAARELVAALSSRSVSSALRYMHDDVYMTSPNGSYHGKGQVGNRLQQGFSSGRSGASFGNPYLDSSNQIVATISSPQGSARMIFEFQGDLVSSMRIAR